MSPRVVMGILSDIWQPAADSVGKIKVVDDAKADSAVFDLPEDVAKELLEKPTPQGEVIAICKSVSLLHKLVLQHLYRHESCLNGLMLKTTME